MKRKCGSVSLIVKLPLAWTPLKATAMEFEQATEVQMGFVHSKGDMENKLRCKSLADVQLEFESGFLKVSATNLKSKSLGSLSCKPAGRRVSWDLGPSLEILKGEDFAARHPRRVSCDTPSHEILDSAWDRKGKLMGRKALELNRSSSHSSLSEFELDDRPCFDESDEEKELEECNSCSYKAKGKRQFELRNIFTFAAGLGVGISMAIMSRFSEDIAL